ncbi:MAG: M48 family metallopeptidase [Limnospira sp.]
MSKHFLSGIRWSLRQWFYPLLSVSVALAVGLGSLPPAQAFSWQDLIFRGIQVIQLSTLSDRQEVSLGEQIDRELVGGEIRVLRNREATAYIDRIGQQLARASDRPEIPYTFRVVDDRAINAFATMGGFVYVNTGLMLAADNEAELASVIAHEIGHIVGRHSVDQMKRMAIAQGVASVAGIDNNMAVQIGVELALRRPHSRSAEYEADRLGVATLGRAGYDPRAAVDFLAKLLGGGSPPTFLSTHPATGDRIEALEREIDATATASGAGTDEAAYRATLEYLFS